MYYVKKNRLNKTTIPFLISVMLLSIFYICVVCYNICTKILFFKFCYEGIANFICETHLFSF